jgi:CHAT domain-containing protein
VCGRLLWSVDDLATGLIMTRFYDELAKAAPAEALARAALASKHR